MYKFEVSERLQGILSKLDNEIHSRVMKKIDKIINSYDAEAYKNLRHDLSNYKRVQIGHFVLVFRFDKVNNLIIFDDFDHHDKIYTK